jgi:uncharacterized membrane protein
VATLLVLGLALAYALCLSTFSILAHQGLKTQMNDLGNADQALWAAAHGDLAMTQSNDLDGQLRSRIAVHANLIFWPLSLLYLLWPNPELLLVLGSLACAAAGLGLYAFARSRLGSTWLSLLAPLAFWLSPIVHDANLYDFHTITVATAFLMWMVWAFDAGRLRLGWVLLVFAMLCQEDVPLVVFMVGVYLALRRSRRTGLLVMAVSLACFVGLVGVVVPAFSRGEGLAKFSVTDGRYAWLGGTPVAVCRAIATRPWTVLLHVLRPDHLRLPVYLLLSGGLAAVAGWPMLLVALPQLAAGLLAQGPWMTRITGTYYWVTSEAVVILACILAAEKCVKARRFPWPLAYLSGATVTFSLLLSPLPYGLGSTWQNYALPAARDSLRAVADLIPQDARLSVQNNLGAHLSHRLDIASFPRRLETADYVLLHLRYVGGPDTGLFVRTSAVVLFGRPMHQLVQAAAALAQSPEWGLVAYRDGFYLFARNAPSAIPREQVLGLIATDASQLEEAYGLASRYRTRWSRCLVGAYSWTELSRAFR